MPPKQDNAESSNTKNPLHPAYTVTNIQNKVRVLDGIKVSYASWVSLFQLHARGYKVTKHIDENARPPAETDPDYESWIEVDSIVLQWIYGTLSDELLTRVLEPESTAREAWLRIKDIFQNNKGSRAAALEHEFSNMTLASMPSLEAYFQKLKDLAGQLKGVDSPVSNQRLVLQLVRGLPPEYDTIASIINQQLPSWEAACNMIIMDQQRQRARDSLTPPAAMAVTTTPPQNTNRRPNYRQNSRPNNTTNRR